LELFLRGSLLIQRAILCIIDWPIREGVQLNR
jgi:hypothetical protein